jgi:sRNA-binding carbon storage regulator CsrA
MSDTNFIGGVVKILENPKQKTIKNNILMTEFRVQFPQVRMNCIVHLKFWGNLARDVATYYKINDYILIEGYLSIKDKYPIKLGIKVPKEVHITVLKIYPFFLNYNR